MGEFNYCVSIDKSYVVGEQVMDLHEKLMNRVDLILKPCGCYICDWNFTYHMSTH